MNDNTRNPIESLEEYKDGLLRSIAIAMQTTNGNDDYSVGLRNGLRVCKAYIDGLEPEYEKCKPSAQPERKKGKWVKDNYGNTVCSECLGIRRDNRRNYTNFCNQCGADMRGYSDEKCMDV